MNGYTPSSKTARKKHLGLSQKEYSKVTNTIKSVRSRRGTDHLDDDIAPNGGFSPSHNDSSFIAETSFVRAPLNSRVVSTSTSHPRHRDSPQSSSKGKEKARKDQESKLTPLDRMPIEVQQALILEDLLFVLTGTEGTYITFHPDYSPEEEDPLQGIKFVVSASLDPSLHDLVERILPLGTYYTSISAFITHRSSLEFGLVNHALCAAIRDMLRDYQTLLAQLEHSFNTSPSFSLQKLWFYIHPTSHTLSLLYNLVLELAGADEGEEEGADEDSEEDEEDEEERARNEALGLGGVKLKAMLSDFNKAGSGTATSSAAIPVKGGEVLSIIYERMQNMSGDPTASTLYGKLLQEAGKPYVRILKGWVESGRLDDPHEEVLVKENRFIDRRILDVDYVDEYWDRRYVLRDGSISPGSSKTHQTSVPVPRSVGGRMPGGACVPPLLEGWKHKILLAGKYLNVIRECGIEVPRDARSRSKGQEGDDDELGMEDERFYTFIENSYSHANTTLLRLLLRDQHLLPRLRSLKRYFFLSQSSWLTHWLDGSASELRKNVKIASTVRLQSLLDVVLNMENVGLGGKEAEEKGEEDYREDVKVVMADMGLYDFLLKVVGVSGTVKDEQQAGAAAEEEQKKEKDEKKTTLTGIDALSLDYTVKFPLSLVISRRSLTLYQLIFRFLLHLKHVEQALSSMWAEHKTMPWRCRVPGSSTSSASAQPSRAPSAASNHTDTEKPTPTAPASQHEFENWRLRVCLLRARMLAFIQQLLAFCTFEVLEPNWAALERKLDKVGTVDELLRDHMDFLDTCLKACMLTSSKLLRACQKLIVVCQTFAFYSSSFTKSANQALSALAEDSSGASDATRTKRWDVLNKFEANFNHWFQIHLDCVQFYASSDNVALLPLVVRLSSVKSA